MVEPAQTLTYPITPDYVKSWTEVRALSEIVANAIDEHCNWDMRYEPDPDSPFGGRIIIEDDGEGIPEEGLVLGYSEKNNGQIGTFGEGKKIGCLVLTRSPHIGEVRFDTVGYSLVPRVTVGNLTNGLARRASTKPVELLAYDLYESARTVGTLVSVEASCELYDEVRERFLHFDPSYIPPVEPGRLITTGTRGRVYIGGVLVSTHKELLFSYDLPLASKRLQNRDRTVIDGWALRNHVRNIVQELTDVNILTKFVSTALTGKLDEGERAFAASSYVQQNAWREAGARVLGDPTEKKLFWAPSNQKELALSLKDDGYTELTCNLSEYEQKSLFGLIGVQTAREALGRRNDSSTKNKVKWVRRTSLTDVELANLEAAETAVRGLYGYTEVGDIKVYSERIVDGMPCPDLGFYRSRSKGVIGLRQVILTDRHATLRTLLHEVAHRLAHRHHADKPVETSDYTTARDRNYWEWADRTRGFESQLDSMLTVAVDALLNAGAVPDPVVPTPEETAPTHGDAFRELFDALLKGHGYKTIAEFARTNNVNSGQIGRIRNGKPIQSCVDADYITNLLGIGTGIAWTVANTDRIDRNDENARNRKRKNKSWSQSKADWVAPGLTALLEQSHVRLAGEMLQRIVNGTPEIGDSAETIGWMLVEAEAARLGIKLTTERYTDNTDNGIEREAARS